jgi:hypothetical protein
MAIASNILSLSAECLRAIINRSGSCFNGRLDLAAGLWIGLFGGVRHLASRARGGVCWC